MKSETSSSKPKMSYQEIRTNYEWIGSANSTTFEEPKGDWKRVFVNDRGTYEMWAEHTLKIYYDLYCD